MKRSRAIFVCAILAACSALGCSGGLSDGGQSGTGIAAIRGNVVAVTGTGTSSDVADIRVSLSATDLVTRTDGTGRFELRGKASGSAELRFERERDGLFAHTTVVIPAGGILDLSRIMIDGDSGEVHPAQQRVQFQGIVDALDCAGGTIRITPKDDDPAATIFTVEVASATIRRPDGHPLACTDLRVGDSVQVEAETTDGVTLLNAVIVLEDDGNEHVQFQGIVAALDCTGGTIVVTPNDGDPAATMFTVEVASATIRRPDNAALACSDLRVGDSIQVDAETTDGVTLLNAVIVLEDHGNEQVQLQGIVAALDCAGGTIVVTPNDDDPQATTFTVEVASATIQNGGVLRACDDLRVGDRLQVRAETIDGSTLINAELVLEAGEDGSN